MGEHTDNKALIETLRHCAACYGVLGVATLLEAATALEQADGWRCFHCDEVFLTKEDARLHFGADQMADPACQIKVAGEHALLLALRLSEDHLARYRAEDSDILRVLWSTRSDHDTAMKREEEKGYARGLRDGQYTVTRAGMAMEAAKLVERLLHSIIDDGSLHDVTEGIIELGGIVPEPAPAVPSPVSTARYMDEVDAARDGGEWLEAIALKHKGETPYIEIETHQFEQSNGGATTLWVNRRPRATFVILRDEANFSVVIKAEMPVAPLPSTRVSKMEQMLAGVSVAPEQADRPHSLWPQAGDFMRFHGDAGHDWECERAAEVFTIGADYEVVDCEVGEWSHSVAFKDIPGRWNGVMFKRAERPASAPAVADRCDADVPQVQDPERDHPKPFKGRIVEWRRCGTHFNTVADSGHEHYITGRFLDHPGIEQTRRTHTSMVETSEEREGFVYVVTENSRYALVGEPALGPEDA